MTLPVAHDIVVAVCTFNRNAELEHLLNKLIEYGKSNWTGCRIGTTIIDDSADGNAKSVTDRYMQSFPLGLVYENSASRNISIARNLALTKSMHRADWIAMTDDDCEPSEQWLGELLRVQKEYAADVVTGPLYRRAPESAPHWLRTQPFLDVAAFEAETGYRMETAFTNNSMISADLLRNNADLRFDPEFGRIGGEDMVFYQEIARRGFKIVFARDAKVYENEVKERLTLRYQLRRHFWAGNSSVLTSLEKGSSRYRLAIHGAATLARAMIRPIAQTLRGKKPQILYGLALVCEAIGKIAGVVGIRIHHK